MTSPFTWLLPTKGALLCLGISNSETELIRHPYTEQMHAWPWGSRWPRARGLRAGSPPHGHPQTLPAVCCLPMPPPDQWPNSNAFQWLLGGGCHPTCQCTLAVGTPRGWLLCSNQSARGFRQESWGSGVPLPAACVTQDTLFLVLLSCCLFKRLFVTFKTRKTMILQCFNKYAVERSSVDDVACLWESSRASPGAGAAHGLVSVLLSLRRLDLAGPVHGAAGEIPSHLFSLHFRPFF